MSKKQKLNLKQANMNEETRIVVAAVANYSDLYDMLTSFSDSARHN